MSEEMKGACEMCGQESHDGHPCPPKAEAPAEGGTEMPAAETPAGDEEEAATE